MRRNSVATKVVAAIVIAIIGGCFLRVDNVSATATEHTNCDPWNVFFKSDYTGSLNIGSIEDIGNYGLNGNNDSSVVGTGVWACNGNSRGIMFVAGKIVPKYNTEAGINNYEITLDIDVDPESTTNLATVMGMVHYTSSYSDNLQEVRAINVAYCTNEFTYNVSGGTYTCNDKKYTVGTDGQGANDVKWATGGIITSASSVVKRQEASDTLLNFGGNSHYWTWPKYTTSKINIDGVELAKKLNDSSFEANNVVKTIKNSDGSTAYIVKLHQFRCWAENGNSDYNHSNPDSCASNPIFLIVKIGWKTTFSGKVTHNNLSGTTYKNGVYYTDKDSIDVYFNYSLTRDNNGGDSAVTNNYSIGTDSKDKSVSLNKNTSKNVATNVKQTVTLTRGKTTAVCGYLYYYATVTEGGKTGAASASDCIKIHSYSWYDYGGKVEPYVNGNNVEKGSTQWIDGNTAELKFIHYLRRKKKDTNAQTKYKTRKSDNLGSSFGTISSYTLSSISYDQTSWSFQQQYISGAGTVTIDMSDNGSTYCQYIDYYALGREDNGSYKTIKTSNACVTLKRYKTNFTGKTTVTVNGKEYSNGDTITIESSDGKIPVTVPVVFKHTVTRNSESTPPSAPSNKKSSIAISTSGTSGCRSGDPCGTNTSAEDTDELASGASYTKTQSINTKVYPDQTIEICQQMTYKNQIWGSSESTATADQVCVTLKMDKALCSDNTQFGIHDGQNLGSLSISKNVNNSDSNTVVKSGAKNTGSTEITMWAKPGDNISFTHDSCAAADLPNQFHNNGKTTTYNVSAGRSSSSGSLDATGYLFGNSIGSEPYTSSSATIATTNANSGTGPFKSGQYAATYKSPSTKSDTDYTCTTDYYGNSHQSKTNYYQITSDVAKTSTLTSARCNSYTKTINNSTDYAVGSNVGTSFSQTLSWTDLWISNDSVNSSHNGSKTASIKGTVSVPYNYYLYPYVGNNSTSTTQTVTPGSSLKANVYLPVMQRENKQVGETYATHTKPTTIRVVSFIMRSGSPASDISYTNGTETLNYSNICRTAAGGNSTLSCTILNNGETDNTYEKRYVLNASTKDQLGGTLNDTSLITSSVADTNDSNIVLSRSGSVVMNSVSVDVPETTINNQQGSLRLGDKVCVAVAAWPSDSHNLGAATSVDSTNQSVALTSSGSGSQWVVSAPYCSTVAKAPSFSVEGSQLSVSGDVTTSNVTHNGRRYGSWTEYGLLAGGTVTNMTSGAATAYIDAQSLVVTSGTEYVLKYSAANRTASATKAGANSKTASVCLYNSQSYLKDYDCNNAGGASTIVTEDSINDILERIRDVYTRKNSTSNYHEEAGVKRINDLQYAWDYDGSRTDIKIDVNGKSYYDLSPRNAYACEYSEDLGYYVPNSKDAERAITTDGKKTAPFYCLSNGAHYYYVEGDAYIGAQSDSIYGQYLNFVDDLTGSSDQETYRNQTMVVHATGTLVIDTNLIVDSYYSAYNGYHRVDLFTDIQQIPQIIIIADKIQITSSVSRIDAWLVADGLDSGNGEINTCAYENFNAFKRGEYIKQAGNGSLLSAKNCDRTLMFNGPVFAKSIILNRTAGGGTKVLGAAEQWNSSSGGGHGRYDWWYGHVQQSSGQTLAIDATTYAQRGEIFNLRADTYLWAYYQAQRNGILTTVFTKELPTRY